MEKKILTTATLVITIQHFHFSKTTNSKNYKKAKKKKNPENYGYNYRNLLLTPLGMMPASLPIDCYGAFLFD